jgi:hypothetical protein
MRLTITVLCLSSLCLSSCANTSTNQLSTKITRSRVTPMTYDGWQSKEFPYIGLRLDLPAQSDTAFSVQGPAKLGVSMHSLSPPPGIVDDATVFVHIYVERIPVSKMTKELEYQSAGRSEESKKYWNWYYELHPTADRYDKGQYAYYRRDVTLNDKEILHAYAEVLNAGTQESRDADHAAVKRILDSIQPLNITTNK